MNYAHFHPSHRITFRPSWMPQTKEQERPAGPEQKQRCAIEWHFIDILF